MTLNWGTPQFDPSKYNLKGYYVEEQLYGPNNTVAQSSWVGSPGAGINQITLPFNQTYQWNTSGDIAGYRVTPIFQNLQTGQTFHNFGGIGIENRANPSEPRGVGPPIFNAWFLVCLLRNQRFCQQCLRYL